MPISHAHSAKYLCSTLLAILLIMAIAGCSSDDGGTTPTQFGAIEGVVRLPFKLATSGEPIAGATVHITAGDFDTVATTDGSGGFYVDQVPARQADLSASLGECLTAGQSVTVRANDTVLADISLESHANFDTISVGCVGATRMQIDQGTNRAILLFDAVIRGGTPGIVSVDLGTGVTTSSDLPDLTDVYDLEIISSSMAVFNFLSPNGYGLRFVDPVTLSQIGDDAIYPSAPVGQPNYEGRLALDPTGETVFVTHVVREDGEFKGKVYAVSVAQRQVLDADDDPFNGGNPQFAFDADLVANSLLWAYNIAFDEATNEILVGNRTTATVTAIDWTMWGQFDRDAGLSIPATGVRVIDMTPPPPYNEDQGFGVELWGFAGGHGIAAKVIPGKVPILHYESGEDIWSDFHVETTITPATSNHVVKIIPSRQSWFTSFRDPDREFISVITAIEEREFGTLERRYRYESRFIEEPGPTAFAIDTENNLLYVAYTQQTFIEIFLPSMIGVSRRDRN